MAVAAVTRFILLMLLSLSESFNQNEHKHHEVTIQALSPKGLRILVEVLDGSQLQYFRFRAKIKRPNSTSDDTEVSAKITAPTNGRWIYEDPCLKLQIGDVINYDIDFLNVYTKSLRAYLHFNIKFPITELVSRNDQEECRPTATRLRIGIACAGQTIFEDNFNSLREDLWQIEQYIPDQPEYPFVSYQRPPNAETVTIDNGYLRIEPKLQQEQKGFSNESLYTGSLNLFNGYFFMEKNSDGTSGSPDVR